MAKREVHDNRCDGDGGCGGPVLDRELWGVSFGTGYRTHARLCQAHYDQARTTPLSVEDQKAIEHAQELARARSEAHGTGSSK